MPYRIVEKSTGKIVAQDIINCREAERRARPRARYEVQLLQTSPVRESGGQSVRLQEQALPLLDIDTQARQAIRDQYPNVIGDSIVVFADHVEYTDAEEEIFSLPFDVDDNGKLTLGQPQQMELRPMEESFRRMGLSESAAKIAAKGHYQGQDDPLVRRILETDRNDRSRNNADIARTNDGVLLASPKRNAQGFYR